MGSLLFLCAFLLYALPDCAFYFVFHLYSNICPAKYDSSNTSGTTLIINACVISLFISPILDLNWRSDLVVKDHQQLPPMMTFLSRTASSSITNFVSS